LSFEFTPARDAAGAEALAERAARLESLAPDFVSVTYGAAGNTADRLDNSIRATALLARATPAARLAHLTLAGHSRAELEQIVARFLATGAEGFLALRGDPPDGPTAPWRAAPGGLTHAFELVRLIRALSPAPIGVAAFPHGHPSAESLEHDAAVLALKQRSGADFAVSQVLFEAEAYFRLRDRAATAGADLPIIPGIMPITGSVRLDRVETFSGGPLPPALSERVAAAASGDELSRAGLEWSVELVRDLLVGGAPGVHFYTVGGAQATEAVCHALELKGARQLGRPQP
jgi:methylenetetrahydrofolate reductase (NADPH)